VPGVATRCIEPVVVEEDSSDEDWALADNHAEGMENGRMGNHGQEICLTLA